MPLCYIGTGKAMSDEHSNDSPSSSSPPPIEGQQQRESEAEWNPDRFPTSATPIFRGWAALALIIALLCGIVYYTSDHSDPEADEQLEKARSEFLDDEGEI